MGYESAGILSSIISNIIKGEDLEIAIRKAIKLCSSRQLRNLLKLAVSFVDDDIEPVLAFRELGLGWTGHEALAISITIYCALRHRYESDHFKKRYLNRYFMMEILIQLGLLQVIFLVLFMVFPNYLLKKKILNVLT